MHIEVVQSGVSIEHFVDHIYCYIRCEKDILIIKAWNCNI